jgi:uncharacterized protein YraI
VDLGNRRTIVLVEDESEGLEHGDDASAADVAPPAPEPAARNPRQVRARRRRRRRQLGTLLFVLVAVAVLATAYFAVTGGDDESSDEATGTSAAVTTTVAPPFSAAYKTTTGINVRQMPATNAPIVAVVEQGRDVTVTCVVEGEVVNGSSGPNAQWLKVTDPGAAGYVSAAYVTAGGDLTAGRIPVCPSA